MDLTVLVVIMTNFYYTFRTYSDRIESIYAIIKVIEAIIKHLDFLYIYIY
uniref:Uncharacterized protein n=1 Tax=Heterorhabditis bacteriophora TaxID=37862 RepID=A0A1I7WDV1_HETBA